jgi:hypothetical protein
MTPGSSHLLFPPSFFSVILYVFLLLLLLPFDVFGVTLAMISLVQSSVCIHRQKKKSRKPNKLIWGGGEAWGQRAVKRRHPLLLVPRMRDHLPPSPSLH